MRVLFSILKVIFKLGWYFKKSLLLIVIILMILSVGYYYYRQYENYNLAVNSCENLYRSKIDNFSSLTGITGLNVSFKRDPKLSKARNIYTLQWDKTINVAGQLDSFKCQYNFATSKALDRSQNVKVTS